jgi:signal transduction histidine kinase
MKPSKVTNLHIWRYVLLWALVVALALGALALFERQSVVRELTVKSGILHRLASQRADQHDAHLTSLSAIFVAGGTARQDLLLDVAATIMRFYPRIASVTVTALDPAEPTIQASPELAAEDEALIRQMARRSTGGLQVEQMPTMPDHYLLVKRSPNTDAAQHGLALVIDAAALIQTDDPFWARPSVSLRLLTPKGRQLTGTSETVEPGFAKPLGSASQPLILEASIAIGVADILPPRISLITVLLATALFLLTFHTLRQRTRAKAAELRADLSAQETRLAHASRVNALGEMASGMAHELAQPLTAILSLAQAGRHLARRGEVARLGSVLDDTVSQAQRASDILDRLRRWSKPNRAPATACPLNEAARSVERLLARAATTARSSVTLALSTAPILVNADPVELEQVVFNLVRNALDASDGARITIRTKADGAVAILEVSDTGPGVPDDIKTRIFAPFVTGKPDGTGLGLALCQRLVEEMGGEILLLPDTAETTFRLSLPLSIPQDAP